MPSLSQLAIAVWGLIPLSHALSSGYDLTYSADDWNSIMAGSESLPASDPFFDSNSASNQGDIGSIGTDWDSSWLTSDSGLFCESDGSRVNRKMRHRRGEMCSPDAAKKTEIFESDPKAPGSLDNFGPDDGLNEFYVVPWDDSPCYPPYVEHLCCTALLGIDPLKDYLFDDVTGCIACSF